MLSSTSDITLDVECEDTKYYWFCKEISKYLSWSSASNIVPHTLSNIPCRDIGLWWIFWYLRCVQNPPRSECLTSNVQEPPHLIFSVFNTLCFQYILSYPPVPFARNISSNSPCGISSFFQLFPRLFQIYSSSPTFSSRFTNNLFYWLHPNTYRADSNLPSWEPAEFYNFENDWAHEGSICHTNSRKWPMPKGGCSLEIPRHVKNVVPSDCWQLSRFEVYYFTSWKNF